jgi:hypothetical protein
MTGEARTKAAPLDRAGWFAGDNPKAPRLHWLFSEVKGWEPWLRDASMGGGRYSCLQDSGHAGEGLATGFAPRKAELSVYIPSRRTGFGPIPDRLGPLGTGKASHYLRRPDRVDDGALRDPIRAAREDLGRRWTVHPV